MSFIGEKFDKNNPERFNLTWIISQLRKDLKKFNKDRFKFLVSKGYSGKSISIKIKQFPKSILKIDEIPSRGNTPNQFFDDDLIFELEKIGNAYNYDNSDSMTDYFDRNYYLHLEFYNKELYMVENKNISKIY